MTRLCGLPYGIMVSVLTFATQVYRTCCTGVHVQYPALLREKMCESQDSDRPRGAPVQLNKWACRMHSKW